MPRPRAKRTTTTTTKALVAHAHKGHTTAGDGVRGANQARRTDKLRPARAAGTTKSPARFIRTPDDGRGERRGKTNSTIAPLMANDYVWHEPGTADVPRGFAGLRFLTDGQSTGPQKEGDKRSVTRETKQTAATALKLQSSLDSRYMALQSASL